MSDLKLQGSGGIFGKEQPVQVRKVIPAANEALIKGITNDNNLDEIVVEGKHGERHVVYADELSVKDGKLPKVGDKVNLPFLDEQVKVIHVDDEINEDRVLSGMSAGFGLSGFLVARLAGGSPSGSDTEIKRFSQLPDVSQKELNWARDVQAKGKQPNAADQAKAKEIMQRHAKQQQVAGEPCKPGSKVSFGELVWALDLARQVQDGHKATPEEAKRYQATYQQLRLENPPVKVPDSDIQWARSLEKKVQTEKYDPKSAEVKRYTEIYDAIQESQNELVMGLLPPDKPPAASPGPAPAEQKGQPSDAELDWAVKLQESVSQGYQATDAELARYENIYHRYLATDAAPAEASKPAPAKPKPKKTS